MKTRPREIQPLLIVAIFFLLAVYPAYLQYNDLLEIDCLSPHPSIENLDQENLLADEQNRIKIVVLSFSPVISLFSNLSREEIPPLSFQMFSLDHPSAILRC